MSNKTHQNLWMVLSLEDEHQGPTKICGWCYPLKMSNKTHQNLWMVLSLEDEQQGPTKICGWCYPLKMSNKTHQNLWMVLQGVTPSTDFGGSLLLIFKG
jgi:hypothetical protein